MGGPISFMGLSSGLDTQAIIDRLMQIERQPLALIEQKQELTEQKLEIYRDLSSRLELLDTSVNALNLQSTVAAKSATSSNTDVLDVTASAAADIGSQTIDSITQLARAASEGSVGVSDRTAEFDQGTYFNFKVGETEYEITLSDDQKTLEGLRDAINAAAGDDVTASIIDTGVETDNYKLVLRSDNTGADYDISDISTDIDVTTGVDLTFVDSVEGRNAVFEVNGVEVSRSSNTVTDVIEGLTIQLKQESGSAVTIGVSRDTTSLQEAVEDFIGKYNDVNSLIQAQFEIDPDTNQAGVLSGDSNLRSIYQRLQQLVVRGIEDSEGNRHSLASIGVDIDKYTGDLSLDETRFEEAVADNESEFFVTLFLRNGVSSDSRVSYVSSTHQTEAGDYGVTVTGYDGDGNVQGYFTLNGEQISATGSGQYLGGASGTDAQGLRVRIASGATGSLGSIYFTVGVAESFERSLDDMLTPLVGQLDRIESRLEDEITGLTEEIESFEVRLEERQRQLLLQFAAAEDAIAQLNSQSSAFQQQLAQL